jgi:hypothetical protein
MILDDGTTSALSGGGGNIMKKIDFTSLSPSEITRVQGGQRLPPGQFRGFRAPGNSGGPNALPPPSLRGLLEVNKWEERYGRPPRGGYETKMGDIYDKNGGLIRRNPRW